MAFKALDDVSKQFEENLKQCKTNLVALKVGDSFDDGISRKLKDLALFTSKLRLLRAKSISNTPEISQTQRNEDSTLSNYGDTVIQKIIEQQIVKSMTQFHAVRKLLTADDEELQQNYREQKQKILSQLDKYRQTETQLRYVDAQLREKQTQYNIVREQWDQLHGELKEIQGQVDDDDGIKNVDPLNRKLKSLVNKMEIFRFLISKFITGRPTNSYDWISDPYKLLSILKLTREHNTVAMFTVT